MAQYSKFVTFDLMYIQGHSNLAPSQKEKLDAYLNYVSSSTLVAFIIDTSVCRAGFEENAQRVAFLNHYLIEHGINPSVIQVLKKNKVHSDFVHGLSEEYDALMVSMSYTSLKPLQKLEIPEPKESIEKTMLKESGLMSTSKTNDIKCSTNTVMPLIYNYELTMNSCDYDEFHKDMVFTLYNRAELKYLKHLPALSQTSHILGAYDFKITGNHDFTFPATLKIPVDHCVDKQELTLFFCKDSSCQLIPMENVYSPEDEYMSFEISKTGIYFLIHFNKRHEYNIEFDVEGNYNIQEFEFNTRCLNMTYIPDIKKNLVSVTLTESYYEPVISIKARDQQGRIYRMTNKPLSLIEGTNKLHDFRVHNFYSDVKTERQFPVYQKYVIKESELKLVKE